jgi:hypothetical protein
MSFNIRIATMTLVAALLLTTTWQVQAATPKPTPTKNPYGSSQQIDPAGPNDVLLTVTNHSKVAKLSMNALRKLGTTQISIYEPFVKVRQTFTVISLAKIFKTVGIPAGATIITDALNDYIYTDTVKNFTFSNGQLAIARFGKPIPYDQGGPIRIIFPDKTPLAQNLNAWNWSLNVIKVK